MLLPFPIPGSSLYQACVSALWNIFAAHPQLFDYPCFNTWKHHKHSLANLKVERAFLFVAGNLQNNIWFSEMTIGKEREGYGTRGLIWALRCFVECMSNLGGEFILWILTLVWCFSPPKHFLSNHLIWCYQQHSKIGQPTRDIHILKLGKLRWRVAILWLVFLFLF